VVGRFLFVNEPVGLSGSDVAQAVKLKVSVDDKQVKVLCQIIREKYLLGAGTVVGYALFPNSLASVVQGTGCIAIPDQELNLPHGFWEYEGRGFPRIMSYHKVRESVCRVSMNLDIFSNDKNIVASDFADFL
jgi:hypothetical protein